MQWKPLFLSNRTSWLHADHINPPGLLKRLASDDQSKLVSYGAIDLGSVLGGACWQMQCRRTPKISLKANQTEVMRRCMAFEALILTQPQSHNLLINDFHVLPPGCGRYLNFS